MTHHRLYARSILLQSLITSARRYCDQACLLARWLVGSLVHSFVSSFGRVSEVGIQCEKKNPPGVF